jgi:hypothetical protein
MAMQWTGPFRLSAIDTAPTQGEDVPKDDARDVIPASWTTETRSVFTLEFVSPVRSSAGSTTSDEVAPSGKGSASLLGSWRFICME